MTALPTLAARVEAASGADWNLDAEIWHATDSEKAECFDRKDAPPFTASIDAALSLVPEGWLLWVTQNRARCWRREDPNERDATNGAAATPALALCAAALSARAAEVG